MHPKEKGKKQNIYRGICSKPSLGGKLHVDVEWKNSTGFRVGLQESSQRVSLRTKNAIPHAP